MKHKKMLALLGMILIVVGLIGVMFTYNSKQEAVAEEKQIPDEHIDAIDIHSNNAKVEIIATNDTKPKAELSGHQSRGSEFEYNVDVVDSTLKIQLNEHQKKLYNFDFGSTGLMLNVYVPEKEYKSINIKNGNGKVTTAQLHAETIEAATANGQLEMAYTIAKTVTIGADNGQIHLSHVETATLDTATDNGIIKMDDVTGDITGRAENGKISLVTDDLERAIDFATDNGKIDIKTKAKPKNVHFDVDIDNGMIDILGTYKKSTIIGNGENLVKLTAKNGTIVVK